MDDCPPKKACLTTSLPDVFYNASKEQIEELLKSEKSINDIVVEKKPSEKEQTAGFLNIFLCHKPTNTLRQTRFVICPECDTLYTANGGQIRRHRVKCNLQGARPENSEGPAPPIVTPVAKGDVTSCLVHYFTQSIAPLNYMDKPPFRSLLTTMLHLGERLQGQDPETLIPSRKTVRNKLVETSEKQMSAVRDLLLPIVEKHMVSFMIDFGRVREDFLAVKASYLQDQLEENGSVRWVTVIVPMAFKSVSAETKDAHSVMEMCKSSIEQLLGCTIDLKNFYLTADGAKNVRNCGSQYFCDYIRCFAHATNIMAKRCLEPYSRTPVSSANRKILNQMNSLVEKSRSFVSALKRDRTLYNKINLRLVDSVETRWMSTYDCVTSVYENIDVLIGYRLEMSETANRNVTALMTADNRKRFKILTRLMKPLKECNMHFQMNSDTIKDVIPAILGLFDEYATLENSTEEEEKALGKFATIAVKKMLSDLSPLHYAAAYLNPASKNLYEIQSRLDTYNVQTNVYDSVRDVLEQMDDMLNASLQNGQTSNNSLHTSSSFLEKHLKRPCQTHFASLAQERAQYDNDTRQLEATEFWPQSKGIYPRLANIAKKVIGVQSSEADVERAFSILKHAYAPNRQMLDLNILENLLILREVDDVTKQ